MMASAASPAETDALFSMLTWMCVNVCFFGMLMCVSLRTCRCALNDDEPGVSLGKVERDFGFLHKRKHGKQARRVARESDNTAARRSSCSPCRVKVREGIERLEAGAGKVRKSGFRAHREVNRDHLRVRVTKSDMLGKCEYWSAEELLAFGPLQIPARVARLDSLQKSKAFGSWRRMVMNDQEPPPTPLRKTVEQFSTLPRHDRVRARPLEDKMHSFGI